MRVLSINQNTVTVNPLDTNIPHNNKTCYNHNLNGIELLALDEAQNHRQSRILYLILQESFVMDTF